MWLAMGQTNPDRARPPPAPEEALTLAEIHVAGWLLMARCRRCGIVLRADVRLLVKVWGPDGVLWGRQPHCPVWECDGRLEYHAQSIRGGTWRSMASPAPQRVIDAWRTKRRALAYEPR